MNELTTDEQNILKDILAEISSERRVTKRFRTNVGARQHHNFTEQEWEKKLDVIWGKLQNGRLTVITQHEIDCARGV
jgi:hypothetical protein